MFSKILIANRGEIACRIMQTAKRMGISTVAVFSDADAKSLHVEMADQAVRVGPALAAESYLNQEKIIGAALDTGAQAIHPGYGFLSENPDFVEAVEAAGLVFIGPSAKSMRAMGLKDNAKALMEKAGVPVVPGYHGDAQELLILKSKANEIGYPVLIKARAGGGGKGMRLVHDQKDFQAALTSAKREARASFGDDRVLVEKYIERPRHIEVQVFGDNHGNAVHLFERDCSLQRRHQKVIEEAPAPGMTQQMRKAMTDAAVKAAKAIDYSGAGTIEFIVDSSNGLRPDGFWFMEMNTRLQVEHPVTEEVTGVDLVEWQLRVANGEKLPLAQKDIKLKGHSFEARLYAEDVPKGFLPAIGTLEHLEFAADARIETGVRQADAISPHYDPMIAKIIATGKGRNAALEKFDAALHNTQIAGTVTNKGFLLKLARQSDFANGDVDTGLIERNLESLKAQAEISNQHIVIAALLSLLETDPSESPDPFSGLGPFVLWGERESFIDLLHGNETYNAAIIPQQNSRFLVKIGNDEFDCKIKNAAHKNCSIISNGKEYIMDFARFGNMIALFDKGEVFEIAIIDPLDGQGTDIAGSDVVAAPMPGVVRQLFARNGQKVSEGERLCILEAMKMEHTLVSPRDGEIDNVSVAEGDQVVDGTILVSLRSGEPGKPAVPETN